MKGLSLFGMILYALGAGFSFLFGLQSLGYGPEGTAMSGSEGIGVSASQFVTLSMAVTNFALGGVLLGMLILMGLKTSPRLARWNPSIMMVYGVLMLIVTSVMLRMTDPLGISLVMGLLGGLMLTSGAAINISTNPFGRTRACPVCGGKVVNWGRKSLTYCTSCEWYFGAIPDSASMMISGDSGVGKTMLILRLANLFLSRGKGCVFVCCDQPPAATKKTIGEIHHSLDHIAQAISQHREDFVFMDAFSSTASLRSDEQYRTDGVFDLNEMNLVLAGLSKKLRGSIAVLVDSVNPLLLHRDSSSVLKFLDFCRAKLTGKGGAFVFSITRGTTDEGTYRKLESIADVVIEMEFLEQRERIRRFRLAKMRGRPVFDEWVYFEVLPREGMVFRPIEKPLITT